MLFHQGEFSTTTMPGYLLLVFGLALMADSIRASPPNCTAVFMGETGVDQQQFVDPVIHAIHTITLEDIRWVLLLLI